MKETLRNIAIAGNLLLFLWMTYNGIDEGFKGTPLQFASYVGVTILVCLNTYVLYRR